MEQVAYHSTVDRVVVGELIVQAVDFDEECSKDTVITAQVSGVTPQQRVAALKEGGATFVIGLHLPMKLREASGITHEDGKKWQLRSLDCSYGIHEVHFRPPRQKRSSSSR